MKYKYVGQFTEQDIDAGRDREAVARAQEETGLLYTNQAFVRNRSGRIIAIKIWVCDIDTFEI